MRSADRRTLLPLAGAAVLAGFSFGALPFSQGLLRVPRTPYDASEARFIVPAWIVLQRAAPLVPRGATVVVRTEPPDAVVDSHFHRFGVALLPGRRLIPAARWGVASEPALIQEAEYEIVVGPTAGSPSRRLVLELPEGSVWRRGS